MAHIGAYERFSTRRVLVSSALAKKLLPFLKRLLGPACAVLGGHPACLGLAAYSAYKQIRSCAYSQSGLFPVGLLHIKVFVNETRRDLGSLTDAAVCT